MRFAIKMFAPMDRPEDSVTIKAMISVFVPTAALNSCWTMLLSAIGRVKSSSFPLSGPCSMSISEVFPFIFARS